MLVKDILFNNINEIQDLLNEGISFKKIDVLSVGNWLYSDQNMKDCEYLNFDRKCLKFRQYLINKGT